MKNSTPYPKADPDYFSKHPYTDMLRSLLEPEVVKACNDSMTHQRRLEVEAALADGKPLTDVKIPVYAFSPNDYLASQAISTKRIADTLYAIAQLLGPQIIEEKLAHEEGPSYNG